MGKQETPKDSLVSERASFDEAVEGGPSVAAGTA